MMVDESENAVVKILKQSFVKLSNQLKNSAKGDPIFEKSTTKMKTIGESNICSLEKWFFGQQTILKNIIPAV